MKSEYLKKHIQKITEGRTYLFGQVPHFIHLQWKKNVHYSMQLIFHLLT